MTSRLIKIFDPPNDRIPPNLLKNVESDFEVAFPFQLKQDLTAMGA